MNMTVVSGFLFLSFALCMLSAAWIARYSLLGSALIVGCSLLFFGDIHVKQEDSAKCPICGHEFIMKMKNKPEKMQE